MLRRTPKGVNDRSRSRAYLIVVGFAAGVLVTGLVLPLAVPANRTSVAGGAGGGVGQLGNALTPTSPTAGEVPGEAEAPAETGVPGEAGLGGEGGASLAAGAATARGTQPGTGAGGGRSGATTGTAGGATGAVGSGGTERGVTADKIKVGAVVLDLGNVNRVGVAADGGSVEEQRANFRAYAEEINARGGIHGRKIEMHFATFDPLNPDSMTAACRQLTQDGQVFVVLGGFNYPAPLLCVVEENRTPLINQHQNNPDWLYKRSSGLLYTIFPGSSRMMIEAVAELERVGLADKKLGVLTDDQFDPGGQVMAELKERLQQRQHNVVYTGRLAADPSAAASQAPIEVNRAQGSGAEVMVLLTGNAVRGTYFVNQADAQRWSPQYVTTDWSCGGCDSVNNNMPRSYDGAINFTLGAGLGTASPPNPEPALSAECRQIYQRRAGRTPPPPTEPKYGGIMSSCDLFRVFDAAATAAGRDLTRAQLTAALQSVGALGLSNYGAGTFSPGKLDYGDVLRTQRWQYDCRCWRPVDGFHRPGG